MFRNSYLRVDLDQIQNNAKYFINHTKKDLIAVIKANGYGVIDWCEAEALEEIGVSFFAVSSLDEALNLRKHGIKSNIILLGYVPKKALDIVKDNDLTITSYTEEFVDEADLNGIKMHLKLNTGMNRLGVRVEDSKRILDKMLSKGAIVEGVMSHYSSADSDLNYSKEQFELFKNTVKSLDYDFKYIHMGASDASIKIEDDISTHCRVGLGLLGFSEYPCDIKPCVSLYSEVIMCKQVPENETVSYNRRFTSDGTGYILTLPLGYADGIKKANVNKQVYVNGEYGTIVGSICMDMMMIHTEKPYDVGTKVELLGEHIDIKKRAQDLGIIVYELLTGLNDRITRIYYKNNNKVKLVDDRFNNIIKIQ